MSADPIPRELVVQLNDNYRHLLELHAQQHTTMATMIRACVQRIERAKDPEGSPQVRRAVSFAAASAARKQVRLEADQALLYLLALATSLENQSKEKPHVPGSESPS